MYEFYLRRRSSSNMVEQTQESNAQQENDQEESLRILTLFLEALDPVKMAYLRVMGTSLPRDQDPIRREGADKCSEESEVHVNAWLELAANIGADGS